MAQLWMIFIYLDIVILMKTLDRDLTKICDTI